MRREIVKQKALIEKLKEEVEEKDRFYEAAIMDTQHKDPDVSEYRSKTEGAAM